MPQSLADAQWYALTVRPRHEQTVAEALAVKGIEPYAPTYLARRQWSDRVKTIALPLFPGYVFCRTSMETRTPILRTIGVREIVSFGGTPQPIPDHELSAVMRMTSSGLPIEPVDYLRTGEQVRVVDGPLRGMSGIVIQSNAGPRIIIGIEMLQRSVSAQLDRRCLEPVAPLRTAFA